MWVMLVVIVVMVIVMVMFSCLLCGFAGLGRSWSSSVSLAYHGGRDNDRLNPVVYRID